MSVTPASALPGRSLFAPVALGEIQLANRVVMAPLTRMRSGASGVPGDLMVEHYQQRSSVGLIVTEGAYCSHESQAFVGQPGIVTDEQVAGWRRVAAAVHARGGRIVMQIVHSGRVTHPDINGGRPVLAPSAIAIDGAGHTERGKQPFPVPRVLTAAEADSVLADFVAASRHAIEAGLDGVEIHAANGYLLHQFLSSASNRRTDTYGGPPENRARFVVETVTAVAQAVGAGRVGLRISPQRNLQDVLETDRDDVLATYGHLLDRLRPLNLAYLSIRHEDPGGTMVQELRRRFGGRLMVNRGIAPMTTREEATELIEGAHADAVAVGRAALANPDLVERWQGGHPENEPRQELFYTSGAEGYNDYPFLGMPVPGAEQRTQGRDRR
ncbi:alkene reductase [Streptomyces olivaceus]|uniref:alkene reductase n=1 Tax=Streptomyces olivaceus TaxID=47716 RepID=UPI0036BB6BC7